MARQNAPGFVIGDFDEAGLTRWWGENGLDQAAPKSLLSAFERALGKPFPCYFIFQGSGLPFLTRVRS